MKEYKDIILNLEKDNPTLQQNINYFYSYLENETLAKFFENLIFLNYEISENNIHKIEELFFNRFE